MNLTNRSLGSRLFMTNPQLGKHTPERRTMMAVMAVFFLTQTGCWEQVSVEWFPQMKWQIAVQAFEYNQYSDDGQLFAPPEGTVPIGWGDVPDVANLGVMEQEGLVNPNAVTLASLKRGEAHFNITCATCHGKSGAGDGPIAAPNGPIAGVMAIGPGNPMGLPNMAPFFTDGHIYTTISLGRSRMPNYNRIPPSERWDVVNYVRELAKGGQS